MLTNNRMCSLAFQYPSIIGFLHILISIKQSQINIIWVNHPSYYNAQLQSMYMRVNLLMYLVSHHHI
jgi:hypothetical protein